MVYVEKFSFYCCILHLSAKNGKNTDGKIAIGISFFSK